MSIEVVPLTEAHLQEAAVLVSGRCTALRATVPTLPARYGEPDTIWPLLRGITAAGMGVAAMRGGQLAGFLSAWPLPSFRGKRSVFSPEWANAAELKDGRRIYEAMYTRLSAEWVAGGYLTHLVSLLANDEQGRAAWQWLGFGLIAADAVRGLEVARGAGLDVEVRRAGPQDLEAVMALNEALRRHLAAGPTFLFDDEERDRPYYEEWLQDTGKAVWLGLQSGEVVAYLGAGPASEDACTIIRDETTTSVFGAFTREAVRGAGVATALLNRALAWAGEAGYERCAVDFEPMNPPAARFWLRHFEPVCYTLVRQVDERLDKSAS